MPTDRPRARTRLSSSARGWLRATAAILSVTAAPAWPQSAGPLQSPESGSVLDKAVVRNRLYALEGTWEAGLAVGLSIVNRLTHHTQVQASGAYNFTENWAVEVRAGYALSGHTGLAEALQEQVYRDAANRIEDVSDLWEMKLNGSVGARWAPIYGKFSILGELPVHFKGYLWLGAGAAQLQRESVLICVQPGAAACDRFLEQSRTAPVATGAVGLKLFTHRGGAVRLELRDYAFRDAFRVQVDRAQALQGGDTGRPAPSPGWIHLAQFDLGYTLHF